MNDSTLTLQVLLAEMNDGISKSLAFSVESRFAAQIYEADCDATALDFFENISHLDLVIVGDQEEFPQLTRALFEEHCKTPVILGMGSKLKDPSLVLSPLLLEVVPRELLPRQIPGTIRSRLLKGEQQAAPDSDFCKIRIQLLLATSPLKSNVFIQLGVGKYLKIFNQGSTFIESDCQKYLQKNITSLFVPKDDLEIYTQAISQFSDSILLSEAFTRAQIAKLSTHLHLTIRDIINGFGVTPEVQKMTEACVYLALKCISRNAKVANLIERFAIAPEEYIASHSLALSQLSCALAGLMGWHSETTFQKLVYASLFHDISLNSNEAARCQTLEEFAFHKELIHFDTVANFESHPVKGAQIANELANIPSDVGMIISQHHETPEGNGFPKRIAPSQIDPLACLFILSHEYLSMSVNSGGGPVDPKDFLGKHKNRYNVGNFREIIIALEKKLTRLK